MKNTQLIEFWTSSQIRRLFRLSLAALCLVAVTWLAFNTSFESHQLLHNNANQTAQSLIRQVAKNAAYYIEKSDNVSLSRLVNYAADDPYVLNAAIYDEQGNFLAGSQGSENTIQIEGLPEYLPGLSKLKDAIVHTVYDTQEKPIGFVSLVYLSNDAMSKSHTHFHQLGRVVLLMLVITIVFTWQIGRALKRWEVKRKILKRRDTRQEHTDNDKEH